MTTHIFFLRHGQTELNAEHKTRGMLDVPLDKLGIKQAKEAGKKIEKEGGVDVIFASTLKRVYQTAEYASEALGVDKITKIADLKSLDYGNFEGKSSDLTDKLVTEQIKKNPFKPIGETGETFQNFKKRFLDAFLEVINTNKGKRILIVGSSSGDRLLRAWIKAGAKTTYEIDIKEWAKEHIENGAFHHWYGIWSKDAGLL